VTSVPDGARVNQGVILSGYAFDPRAATGTGVDGVHVYLYPNWGSGQPAQFLGLAPYPLTTDPTLGPQFGSQFSNAAFRLFAQLPAPGTHLLVFYAHSSVDGSFAAVTRLVTIPAPQFLVAVEQPQPNQTLAGAFAIYGWAMDRADVDVPDDSGIEFIQLYAYPVAGGSPIFLYCLGSHVDRPDIAAAYGPRFLNSGFYCPVNAGGVGGTGSLSPGTYDLAVFALSKRTKTYSPPVVVRFSVQ